MIRQRDWPDGAGALCFSSGEGFSGLQGNGPGLSVLSVFMSWLVSAEPNLFAEPFYSKGKCHSRHMYDIVTL